MVKPRSVPASVNVRSNVGNMSARPLVFVKGAGAVSNQQGRFERDAREVFDELAHAPVPH